MTSSAFRVTQQTMGAQSFANLQASLDRLQGLQERLSSGKRVQRPSDDPTSMGAALKYRTQLARSAQYQRSIDDAQGWLGTADTSLRNTNTLLQQVHDLVLQGMNASVGPSQRQAIASQVDEIGKSLLGVANTTYLGRPVFGGTVAGTVAYGPAGQYVGDSVAVTRMVEENTVVTVGFPGTQAFGSPPNDVFTALATIAADLRSAPENLGADLGSLEQRMQSVLDAAGVVGAREQTLEGIRSRAQEADVSLRGSLSEAEDIDLPKALMDLNLQQAAYQAALAATQRVIQPSLVDFLR